MLATRLLALTLITMFPQQPPSTDSDEPVVVVGEIPSPQPTPAARKAPKPEILVRCTPPISNAQYTTGGLRSTIICTVRVTNPTERFWCPEVAWSFGEGRPISTHEGDCDPYEKAVAEKGEPESWSEDPKVFGLPPGTYQIWAKLSKAGRVIGKDYSVVRVN